MAFFMPPSPDQGTTSRSLNAHPAARAALRNSITQATSSFMAPTQSLPGSQRHSLWLLIRAGWWGDLFILAPGGPPALWVSPTYGEHASLDGEAGPTRKRKRSNSPSDHERSPYHLPIPVSPLRPRSPPRPNELYNPPGPNFSSSEILSATSAGQRRPAWSSPARLLSQSENKAEFTCPVEGCRGTFARQFNLKAHMRSHRGGWAYGCKWPKCAKVFARLHDCKRHEALHLIHPSTRDECGEGLAGIEALNRHHISEGVQCRQTTGQTVRAALLIDGRGRYESTKLYSDEITSVSTWWCWPGWHSSPSGDGLEWNGGGRLR